ncbi:patatin-like phospholipase family protein [Streptomyces sp. CRN 30]|uniref:patatin-like phospholipase family protein n=1 Tax=Streptomyces sp. CRN 30 TaxID=3075613 RepID=UPI002A7F09AD|nr:patatin-like phospholipase family protein [Streptomyces sp. CRN 30]
MADRTNDQPPATPKKQGRARDPGAAMKVRAAESSFAAGQRKFGEEPPVVGMVLAGAGARGAYEAGVASVLLPVLEECGMRPTVFIGTSAGAINAAHFAATAHLTATDSAAAAVELWAGITKDQVFKPFLQTALLRDVGQGLAELLRLPGGPLTSLLDTEPLRNTLATKVDWSRLHENTVDGSRVEAVGVAATSATTGRTQVFVEGQRLKFLRSLSDADRAVDYEPCGLEPKYVQASAAIPVAFPPVHIDGDWYIDGGVRLNAPLKPALDLGANRLVVIATDPEHYDPPRPPNGLQARQPTVQDMIALIMRGALNDRMIEDIRTAKKINGLVESARTAGQKAVSRTGHEYRSVGILFGGPGAGQFGQLGATADDVLERDFPPYRLALNPDLAALATLLSAGQSSGELLSYLFFEPSFLKAAIEHGQDDAQRVVGLARDMAQRNHGFLRDYLWTT